MKGKKGFLLLEKNVIELVLAFIGILLILGVVVYAFGLLSTAQVKRNAQTSLDILESRANSLQDGEMVLAKLPGLCKGEECDWFIASWNKEDAKRPETYLLKNIICVCQGSFENPILYCNSQESCREITSGRVEITPNSFSIKVDAMNKAEGKETKIVNLPIIPFSSNLLQVEISKSNGVVSFKKV